ncbi:DNA polymerase [Bacillus safensis]|uniref:DNA polymerase n=1 Tax=Bacillus safensis TaxID=561879 RepID=UPI00204000E1|nr:DNA polymerase [Bacillus safensis]
MEIKPLKLNVNAGKASPASEVAKRKQAAKSEETLDEAFDRLKRTCKFSDKERREFEAAWRAQKSGELVRTKNTKLTKTEACAIGRRHLEKENESLRHERMRETLRTKPDNYYVITRDADLSPMIERLRAEVRAQQLDPWFRKVFDLFNNTHIRGKLTERGIEVPLAVSFTEWDTETSGTDTFMDMSGGYSFWLPCLNEGYYVAYGHLTEDEQCTRSAALDICRVFIEDARHIKSFHNTPFDYAMFLNDGLKPKGFRYDSLDAARLMNEHEPSFGLKELDTKYKEHTGTTHLDGYTFEDLFGKGSPMIYSPEIVGIYAIKDVEKGWYLTRWQIDMMLKIDDLYYPYFEIRQYLYEVNTTIERTGFVIDDDELLRLKSEYEPQLQKAIDDLNEAYGIDAEFLRSMSMHLKGDKIRAWQANREKQIAKQKDMLAKCEAELQKANPATKKYTQLKERIRKYKTEPLAPAIPENAPDFIHEFNLDSDQHLQYLIYDVLGIEDKTKIIDKKKTRAVSKDVLALYFKEDARLKPLAIFSELSTLLGTFINRIPNVKDVDGRLHTQLQTVSTGRYSSKKYTGKDNEIYRNDINDKNFLEYMRLLVDAPKKTEKGRNIQNIPSRTERGQRVRMAFKPPEGCTFIGSDLSSIEPRIQAHRMATEFNDEIFADMYRRGLDPYVEFASILFDVPREICTEDYYKSVKGTDDVVPAYRKAMKQMFLAIGYGQAFDMFYKGVIPFGIGKDQALVAYEKFDEILPGFKGMVESTFEHLRKHGWTATIFKQKRRFPGYVEKYKRLCQLMRKCGITDKNDPDLGKKTNKLRWEDRSEFWDLMRFTGGCERAAFNHTIQGSGANILQMCMIRVYYECVLERGWEFPLTLHDELKTATPNEQLTKEAVELFDDIMTNTFTLVLPLGCDTVIEPCWMDEYSPDDWDFEKCKPKKDVIN